MMTVQSTIIRHQVGIPATAPTLTLLKKIVGQEKRSGEEKRDTITLLMRAMPIGQEREEKNTGRAKHALIQSGRSIDHTKANSTCHSRLMVGPWAMTYLIMNLKEQIA
jgi:hypothetical protein